ncbi:MAG: phosphatidylglycerophosphatase A [Candidatus Dadabacteria bacterium]
MPQGSRVRRARRIHGRDRYKEGSPEGRRGAHLKQGAAKLVATFFGTGYFPYGPGTIGTIAAIPLYYLFSFTPPYIYALLMLAVIAVSVWASDVMEKSAGRTDPGFIVADEVSGYLVTMAFAPVSVTSVVLGFFLFRLFDITKPPPARQLERLGGGMGIVMDDVAAGVYANIVLQVMLRYVL